MSHFIFRVVEFRPPFHSRAGIWHVEHHVVTATDHADAAKVFFMFWAAKPGHRYFMGTEGTTVMRNVTTNAGNDWFPKSQLDEQVAWLLGNENRKFIEFTPGEK